MAARHATSATPKAAPAAPAASAASPVMFGATSQRLADVRGVLEVPVAAGSARSEGAVRVGVSECGRWRRCGRVVRADTPQGAGRGTARHPEGSRGAKNATRRCSGCTDARRRHTCCLAATQPPPLSPPARLAATAGLTWPGEASEASLVGRQRAGWWAVGRRAGGASEGGLVGRRRAGWWASEGGRVAGGLVTRWEGGLVRRMRARAHLAPGVSAQAVHKQHRLACAR